MHARIRIIWNLIEVQRRRYVLATVAMLVASFLLYLAPLVPQIVIDGVLFEAEKASPWIVKAVSWLGGAEFLRANLWWPGSLVILFTGGAGLFTYWRGRWSAQASEAIACDLRDEMYDHIQHLPCTYLDEAKSGDLIQRCTSDVETVRVFLATQIVEIARAVVMFLMPLPFMFAIDWRMTLVSIALIPAIIGFSLLYFRRVRLVFKEVEEAESRMTTTVQENLAGIRVVRAFARQQFEIEKFLHANAEHRDRDRLLYKLLAHFWSISDVLCFAQKALMVGAGAYWIAQGSLQVGAFFYFLTAVNFFLWPVRMMGRILTDVGKTLVALGRIDEVRAAERESEPHEPLKLPQPIQGEVAFKQVHFAHGEAPVLHEVNFVVPAGTTLAIVGPSGSGKSTIINLLLRMYDPDDGTISIDGIPVDRLPRKELRRQIATVMQEPFLFSRTLRENIAMGHPNAGEAEIIEAATTACVHDSILEFEQDYETIVGERGVTLSGGQRQRVAISRALLQKPAVLILDDALSAVDAETETLILNAFAQRHQRQTTIVIAHRLSTLAHADQILVVEEGRITQQGTHESLIEAPGLYRRLWQIQTQPALTVNGNNQSHSEKGGSHE